jgi:serine/threonine-protein kinase RsbW
MATDLLPTMHSIDFPSKAENIHLVEQMIDAVCEEHKVAEDHYGNILIAMTEAVNNAIHHGNGLNPVKKTSVSFDRTDTQLKFTVLDEGIGFDYENLPDPTSPENLEKPNGRGIFLMKNLADEISFEDNGRKVELIFNIQ